VREILLVVLLAMAIAPAQPAIAQAAGARANWVGSWAASQQIAEPQNALAAEDLRDATLRQIVQLSIGGSKVRVHVSNTFGTAALHIASVHIARPVSPASARIDAASDKTLSFSGSSEVTVPAGAEYVSDPVDYAVRPLSDLAITLRLDTPPAQLTWHPGARATSYLVHGDFVSAADLPDAMKLEHWYLLAGVDVMTTPGVASIVVLGDSITDGHGATTNGNDRWTDTLAQRLHTAMGPRAPGVLNEGIGGNHLLTDGVGLNALARFDRDVLAQAGVRYLIVLEGVNDLGALARAGSAAPADRASLLHRLEGAYEQIVARAHAHGIKVIGATILPFKGSEYYHPGPDDEAARQALNQWIRTPGNFDAVVDFDKVMQDPAHPEHMLSSYDSGDHLHPSPPGFRAMAAVVPVSLFTH
jgi:lysophospholipase L1-like esterase